MGNSGVLMIGSTAGITTSGATGSVQTTTRTFNTAGNYVYNGAANQVTGNGLPATVRNFSIANTASGGSNVVTVTTAFTVSDSLTLTSGILNTVTNSAPITLSNTTTPSTCLIGGSSTCYVQGPLARTFAAGLGGSGSYTFPIGATAYLPITYSTLTTGGTAPVLKLQAFSTGAGAGDNSTLNTSPAGPEYWQSTSVSGNFTSAYVSIGRQTAPPTATAAIGQNTSGNSSYASIGGATTGTGPCTLGPSTTLVTAASDYFTMGQLYFVPAPTITSFSVDANGSGSSDYVGSTITVTGTNLNSVTVVKVGGSSGTSATIATQSSTSLTFYAPNAGGQIYVLNGGGNYTYTTTSYTNLGYITTTTGDWNTAGTWLGGATYGVPAASSTVTIANAVTVNGTVANASSSVTVNGSKTLTFGASGTITITTLTITGTVDMSAGGALTIAAGGTFTNNGAFTTGGTVVITNAATINGSNATTFSNLTLTTGTLTLSTVPTINGNFTFSGGSLSAAPKYGGSSYLIYNMGSTYARGNEWSANGTGTIGTTAGYPNHITLQNNTTLNYTNGVYNVARSCNGNLLITSGSALYMDYGTSGNNQPLNVLGSITVNGALSLGDGSGGDLNVGGSFTVASAAVANGINFRGRAVNFNGTGTQVITNTATGNFNFAGSGTAAYFLNSNTGGTVQLSSSPATSVTITQTSGNVVQMLSSGTLDLNGQTFTMNGGSLYTNGSSRSITLLLQVL